MMPVAAEQSRPLDRPLISDDTAVRPLAAVDGTERSRCRDLDGTVRQSTCTIAKSGTTRTPVSARMRTRSVSKIFHRQLGLPSMRRSFIVLGFCYSEFAPQMSLF